MKHQFLVATTLLASVALVAATPSFYKIIESVDSEVEVEGDSFVDKRQVTTRAPAGRSCGAAPNPGPLNARLVSTPKTSYVAGDVLSYRCEPAYMRLIQNSLSVTCQANGTWSALPVCQSYTGGCRRTKLAREYRGKVNRTRCGKPCQAWTVDSPQRRSNEARDALSNPAMFPEYLNPFDAQNFCRNPDAAESTGPWCYINQNGEPRWGYCDVTYCEGFDIFDEYDRVPGACGCQGEWYNAIRNYGNIKSIEGATLQSCKAECDDSNQCQGIVFDEQQNKCWLKKCSCTDNEVTCTENKHETYYRKKTAPCPGVERYDQYGQRTCYFSLYNFNLNASLIYDWQTSRKLCQALFPIVSDIASLETDAEWDFIARNVAQLRIPVVHNRLWLGLFRQENVSDSWTWVDTPTVPAAKRLANYSRWAAGEPTNNYEEQCTQVILAAGPNEDRSRVGRWADESCRLRAPVLCEAKMPNWSTSKREYNEIADNQMLSEERRGDEQNKGPRPHCKTDPCPENEEP